MDDLDFAKLDRMSTPTIVLLASAFVETKAFERFMMSGSGACSVRLRGPAFQEPTSRQESQSSRKGHFWTFSDTM